MKRDELETEEKPQTAEHTVSMPTADNGDWDRFSRQSFYFCDVREQEFLRPGDKNQRQAHGYRGSLLRAFLWKK